MTSLKYLQIMFQKSYEPHTEKSLIELLLYPNNLE